MWLVVFMLRAGFFGKLMLFLILLGAVVLQFRFHDQIGFIISDIVADIIIICSLFALGAYTTIWAFCFD